MQIIRRAPGEASLALGERILIDLVAAEVGDEEFEAVLERLEGFLKPTGSQPRLALTLQEGLLGAVQTELPLELVVIEEDPHDLPPLRITRHVVTPDPAALAVMLDRVERRLARSGT
ncbi:hypothetical protein [Teichococcus vastitatis]|jgi:hypothetical protein|uniref:Uncharacterized protein n=1 Tax=Teichococcus vastitatis TaxID=2307076 RepID=A0ABS9W690_9PROT|nr:hypothetical protein [Pseudoroseomonas vastitatis]MCI0754801.1 hypothetical protein [Pseudoroseomonas vastitatis]